MNAKDEFLNAIPAGDWTDIEIISDAQGMMATHNWAILAKARWSREGGREAFLKYLVPASGDAGETTNLITGKTRLIRLKDRIENMGRLGTAFPMVPILDIRFLEPHDGLLIAMERVEPLHDIIVRHESTVELAIAILEKLHCVSGDVLWHHFDICPKNIGVRKNGEPVFIDVESLYENSERVFDITVPAWKRFRAPHDLILAVERAVSDNRQLSIPIAGDKQRYELALVAAECCIGLLSQKKNAFDMAVLSDWKDRCNFPPSHPLVQFWVSELSNALANQGRVRSILEIARDLRLLLESGSMFSKVLGEELRPDLLPASIGDREFVQEISVSPLGLVKTDIASTGFADGTIGEIRENAISLRSGELSTTKVAAYRARLESMLVTSPSSRELWNELILIVWSFQKDPHASLSVLRRALRVFPGDGELMRNFRIASLWASGTSNE